MIFSLSIITRDKQSKINFRSFDHYLVLFVVGWRGDNGKWNTPLRVGGAELARDGEEPIKLAVKKKIKWRKKNNIDWSYLESVVFED